METYIFGWGSNCFIYYSGTQIIHDPFFILSFSKVTFQHKGFEETRRLGRRNETEQV